MCLSGKLIDLDKKPFQHSTKFGHNGHRANWTKDQYELWKYSLIFIKIVSHLEKSAVLAE